MLGLYGYPELMSREPHPPLRPAIVRITHTPERKVWIGYPDEDMVDITASVVSVEGWEISAESGQARVILDLVADHQIEFDFDVVGALGDPLAGVHASDIDGVLATVGMSEKPGAAVLAHLRARLGQTAL